MREVVFYNSFMTKILMTKTLENVTMYLYPTYKPMLRFKLLLLETPPHPSPLAVWTCCICFSDETLCAFYPVLCLWLPLVVTRRQLTLLVPTARSALPLGSARLALRILPLPLVLSCLAPGIFPFPLAPLGSCDLPQITKSILPYNYEVHCLPIITQSILLNLKKKKFLRKKKKKSSVF